METTVSIACKNPVMCLILRFMVLLLVANHALCADIYENARRTPWDLEVEHNPIRGEPGTPRIVNATKMPEVYESPDFRLPEPPFVAYPARYLYQEKDRPYRMSPHAKMAYRWSKVHKTIIESENIEHPYNLGCYCTTVYKRLTVLAGCAVLTPRHILTTATSTELVIKDRHNDKTLENVLGAWYDIKEDIWNSSMYMTPARIHYHPKYLRPENVNISHPLPIYYDLAVWASTYPLDRKLCSCLRANSGWWEYGSTVPRSTDMIIVVGFQYIRSLRRRPTPWFKYATRTMRVMVPCPKTDWGWFHCLEGMIWSKFGIESGAAWHRATRGGWMTDGLAGMCAFSLHLRSDKIVHYFTVLNQHPVTDFMYDAYMGRLPYEYLDQRFWNSQWRSPVPKEWYRIPWTYNRGEYAYKKKDLPFYK